MRHLHLFVTINIILAAQLAAGAAYSASAGAAAKAVAVVNSEIVVDPQSLDRRVLTDDGIAKTNPLWSMNGELIADLDGTPRDLAAGKVVVVDDVGKKVFETLVASRSSAYENTDVQYIDSLQWLSDSVIMAGGKINPSQSQYFIFDLRSQKTTDIVDDRSNPSVSPNGQYIAFLTRAPHWRSEGGNSPAKIHVRERFHYPESDILFDVQDVLDGPIWSQDSRQVTLVQKNRITGQLSVIVKPISGLGREIQLPNENTFDIKIHWQGPNIFVENRYLWPPGSSGWIIATKDSHISRAATDTRRTLADVQASDLRQQLLNAYSADKTVRDPDVWCKACSLSILPRKSPQESR